MTPPPPSPPRRALTGLPRAGTPPPISLPKPGSKDPFDAATLENNPVCAAAYGGTLPEAPSGPARHVTGKFTLRHTCGAPTTDLEPRPSGGVCEGGPPPLTLTPQTILSPGVTLECRCSKLCGRAAPPLLYAVPQRTDLLSMYSVWRRAVPPTEPPTEPPLAMPPVQDERFRARPPTIVPHVLVESACQSCSCWF
ncbi:hypothetical protein Vretifemale_20190 [Volvox reticuliferus]|uniref:Uncharacterized protein n=1 Tax=Volvox reticuliferus TaxID=1737510 RepID=A0A8J4D0F8_9CHLO|nr:hypothetical protein Vretifemale_20190 [Volvox reticuliferus]